MIDCNSCENLNLTEKEQEDKKEQTGRKEDHICLIYNQIVFHNGCYFFEPKEMLYPCRKCLKDNYINYKTR